ncbi:CsbD family protein [Bacillus sp. EB600]|uniref:CsbD family protein n=1 Tax=Bacillus sp. EB600 TaxID=2806345 RepID=UPI0021093573|nr:CsbD family protein [Bacillus sp. EB600]MCQ6282756.1 CsbD family protein [Bacillus sp. EB600]
MNRDKINGSVDQLKGEAKEQWGKLTDKPSKVVEGKMDKAKGKWRQGVGEVKEKLSE